MHPITKYPPLVAVLLVASTASANMDVLGDGGSFIKVTLSADKSSAAFEYCTGGPDPDCKALGTPDDQGEARYYTLKRLRQERTIERLRTGGTFILDLAVLAAGWAVGVLGAEVVMGSNMTYGAAAAGMLTGVAAGGVVIHDVDAINPFEQHREARMLRESVITDEDVHLHGDLATYAYSLDEVLKKI